MNKKVFLSFAALAFFAAAIFSSCSSSTETVEDAQTRLDSAKQELKDAKAASAEQWTAFKGETQTIIDNNEARIAQLKTEMSKPGKILDPVYEKRIDQLEADNKALAAKLNSYEAHQSDWEAFKVELNHDVDELSKALNDFTVDNKK